MAKRISCSSGGGGFANLKNNEVPKCELSSGAGGFSSSQRDIPFAGSASDYEDDEDYNQRDEDDCLNTAIL